MQKNEVCTDCKYDLVIQVIALDPVDPIPMKKCPENMV